MLLRTLALSVYVLLAYAGFSQTAIQTSFETAQGYTAGNLHNQQGWSLTTGSAVVTTAKFHSGTQSVQMTSSNTAYLLNYVAYSGSVPGITGEVYTDCWINPVSFATKGIAINGYDLYGGSSKRIFVIEFGIDNTIKVYNGSGAVNVGTWTSNQWVRLSVKMDFATEKYKVAINGAVLAADYSFRETYTPTASGTRQAGVKEFPTRFASIIPMIRRWALLMLLWMIFMLVQLPFPIYHLAVPQMCARLPLHNRCTAALH